MKNLAESKLVKTFDKFTYNHDKRKLFETILDFIIFCTTIEDETNPNFPKDFQAMITAKNDMIKDFKDEEIIRFQEIITLLGEATTQEDGTPAYYDALGDLFMTCISSNNGGKGRNDQFFTPQYVSDVMAKIQGNMKEAKSVSDCCCGSGRMLLATAKQNPDMLFFGSDIDHLCVKMCVVNLTLNGLEGEIVWGNPLTFEAWKVYQIQRNAIYGVPIIRIRQGENSISFRKPTQEKEQQKEEKKAEKIHFSPKKTEAVQLTFSF